jgi:ferric-dicitrate binding protein FerR (iron transport regulator)
MAVILLLIAAGLARRSFRAPPAGLATANLSTISTGSNERREVRLGDDAVVTLAADSRIRYGVTTSRTEVELAGAAQFTVVRSHIREFEVRARNAHVLDLGSDFIVRAYDGDSAVIVAVHSGVVAINDVHHQTRPKRPAVGAIRVDAGQLISLFPDGRISPPVRFTDAQYSSLMLSSAGARDSIVK